jgi:hypothetical protein
MDENAQQQAGIRDVLSDGSDSVTTGLAKLVGWRPSLCRVRESVAVLFMTASSRFSG